MSALSQMWSDVQAQLRASLLLRLGCWAVLGLLWGYGLMVHADMLAARQTAAEELTQEIARLKPMRSDNKVWPLRLGEAEQRVADLQAMMWTEASAGLAQAGVQDWLRQASTKAGVTVKDLRLATSDANLPSAATARGRGDAASASPNAQGDVVRARLVVEFKPTSLASLLQDIAMNPRVAVVDRLQLKTWGPAPQAELDIRIPVLKLGPAN